MSKICSVFSATCLSSNFILWRSLMVGTALLLSCCSPLLLKKNNPLETRIGALVDFPTQRERNHLLIETSLITDSIRLKYEVEKTNRFNRFFLKRKSKRKELENDLDQTYHKVKFTFYDLENKQKSNLDKLTINFSEAKSYGFVSAIIFLLPKEELEKIGRAKEIKYHKDEERQFGLRLMDSMGKEIAVNFRSTQLIDYELLHFCEQKKPFGQQRSIRISSFLCADSDTKKERRKQLKKALLR